MNRFSTFRNINLAAFGFVVFAGACSLDKWGTQPGGPLGVGGSGGSGGDAVTVSNSSGTSSASSGPGGSGGSGGSGGGQPCSGGLVLCDGMCVDMQSDIQNCGGCMVACTAMQPVCENGACKACKQGDTLPCYSGPQGTEGVGACKPGLSTCLQDGSGFGQCMGDVVPSAEICGNNVDENCDNVVAVGSSCLASQGLVVRYFLDEAASGQTPAAALDSAPNPRDLAIAYTSQLNYTGAGTGRGLAWSANDGGGVVTTTTDNTKILSMLEGKVEATIEVVAKIDGVSGNYGRIVSLGSGSDNRFALGTDNTGGSRLRFEINGNESGAWLPNLSGGRAVFHVVMNNADGNAGNRVRLYMNGAIQTNTSTTPPAQNTGISIGALRYFNLGNRETSTRSMRGVLYYAAVYSRALTDGEIANNVGILSANDDK